MSQVTETEIIGSATLSDLLGGFAGAIFVGLLLGAWFWFWLGMGVGA